MKVAELIEKRQPQWQELETLCKTSRGELKKDPLKLTRFSELYRSTCADLALSESYNLPPQTVEYLHRLVAIAHNQLYRSSKFQWQRWYKIIFEDTPQGYFQRTVRPFLFLCVLGFVPGRSFPGLRKHHLAGLWK